METFTHQDYVIFLADLKNPFHKDYEYLTRNVFPGSIKPQDLGTGNDEEGASVWCKVLSKFSIKCFKVSKCTVLSFFNLLFLPVPASG